MSESARTVIYILLVALIALAGGRFVFRVGGERRMSKGLFRPEFAVYLGLGLLLGNNGLNIIDSRILENLEPVVELALGWTGMLFGLQFSLRRLKRYPTEFPIAAFLQGLTTIVVLCAVLFPLAGRYFPLTDRIELWGGLLVLAVVGAVSSPSSTALAARSAVLLKPQAARLAHYISSMDAVLPLFVFSMIAGYLGDGSGSLRTAFEWVVVSILLGLVVGFLFYSFARHRHGENELTFLIVAFTVFIGGIASYLGLSSLFVSAMVGFILANRLEISERIFRILAEREKPILVVFLIIVGASWELTSVSAPAIVLLMLVAYLAARVAGKLGGMAAAGALFRDGFQAGGGLTGLALLGQGGMSIALVANYQLLFEGRFCDFVVTVALLAVVIGEMFGAYAARLALAEKMEESG
jgi:Sodium/hydrogen exchanger family